jgi:hypothetical protein
VAGRAVLFSCPRRFVVANLHPVSIVSGRLAGDYPALVAAALLL